MISVWSSTNQTSTNSLIIFVSTETALIELPQLVRLNDRIQLAKFAKTDYALEGNENVIAIGTGHTRFDPDEGDNFLREAEFVTMDSYECSKHVFIARSATICAKSNVAGVYKGDSGKFKKIFINN